MILLELFIFTVNDSRCAECPFALNTYIMEIKVC